MAARLLPSLLAVLLIPTAPAHAGGLPPTSLEAGPEGVLEPTGEHRFTAVPLATRTVLTKSETHGGRVLRASILDGRWGVPVVANDGTSAGISADGARLVLTRVAQADPRRHTGFAVIDARSMALRDTVELDGEWRFDALSSTGRRLYLIEQPEGVDPARAMFRAYDLRHRRLLPDGDRIVASAARRPRRASAGGGPPGLAVGAALTGLLLAARGTRRARASRRRRAAVV